MAEALRERLSRVAERRDGAKQEVLASTDLANAHWLLSPPAAAARCKSWTRP